MADQLPPNFPPDVEGMKAALAEHKRLVAEKAGIDSNSDELAKKLESLGEPVTADEAFKLLGLALQLLESQRKSMVQIDERLDWLITQYMEGAILVAEAQQT